MTHRATLPLFALALLTALTVGGRPAAAICIQNNSKVTIIAKMTTPNPLGSFVRRIKPNNKACCDWFDRRCSPTARRDAPLMFTFRERTGKESVPSVMFCGPGPGTPVWAVGDGTITVTSSPYALGRLVCDSRDMFQNEVDAGYFVNRARGRSRKPAMPAPIVVPPPPE